MMVKSSSLLFSLLLTIPVILCAPQSPQVQQQPQISPPRPGPITLPADPPTDTNNSTQVIPDDALPVTGTIGNHVQPGVIIHNPDTTDDNANSYNTAVQPTPAVLPPSFSGPGCPKIYRPLCGSNQVTYNSPCEFRNAQQNDPNLTQEKDGVC